MPRTLIQSVISQLQKERARLKNELAGVSAALTAFGKVYLRGTKAGPVASRKKRIISAAGRKRIAAAQKKRWAKIRAGKKSGKR
jgi:16S rRNA G1207 methylase RsmC